MASLNNHRPFWIVFEEKLGQRNHVIIMTSSFSKSSAFLSHKKDKFSAFKFLRFEVGFQKAPFS